MAKRRKNPAQLVILGNPRRRSKKRNAGNGHKPSCSCPICKNMRGAGKAKTGKARRLNPKFTEFLKSKLGTDNWVVARRTPRIVKKYGSTVKTLSRKQYDAFESAFRKANPDEMPQAVARYEEFHGRQPDKILSRQRSAAMRADYVALGPLLGLGVFVPGIGIPSPDHWDSYPHLKFERDVKLASNAEGTQLYAIGGDQDCSAVLDQFEGVDRSKDIITLGELAFVVYLARKRPDPTKPTEYMHKFGLPRPMLGYDQVKQEIFFIGGSYVIREWIEG